MPTFLENFLRRIAYAPDAEGAGGGDGEVSALASVSERADAILDMLGDDDDGAAVDHEISGDAGDTAPKRASGESAKPTSDAVETDEPGEPAIEPPPTWKAELKQKWNELPRDLQQTLAQWESERNVGFNAKLNEAAEVRKQAEALAYQAQAERQRYAQTLETIMQTAQGDDPVLVQGMRTDWQRLAQEDPVAFVQQRAAFEAAYGRRQQAIAEYQAVQERQRQDLLMSQQRALTEKLPEWGDKGKREAMAQEIAGYLLEKGYSKDEIKQAVDHRALLVANEVISLRKKVAEYEGKAKQSTDARQSAAAKRVADLPRVQKPGGNVDGASNPRVDALKRNAVKSGRTDDLAAAILNAL